MTLHNIIRYLHVLSAVIWIGGNILFFSFGFYLRKFKKYESYTEGFRALGRIFRLLSWICVFLLILTGFHILLFQWNLSFNSIMTNDRMTLKLILFSIVLLIKLTHDFFLAPMASKKGISSIYFPLTLWIARINLILVLIILYISMVMVR